MEDGAVLCYEQLSEKAKNDIVSIIRDLPADQKTAMIDSLNIFKELGTYTASDLKAFLALAMDREKCDEIQAPYERFEQIRHNKHVIDEIDKIDFQHPVFNKMTHFMVLATKLIHLDFVKEFRKSDNLAEKKLGSFLYDTIKSIALIFVAINDLYICGMSCSEYEDIAYKLKSMGYYSSQLLEELK